MKISDSHNDILSNYITDGNSANLSYDNNYNNKINKRDYKVCCVIWTTELHNKLNNVLKAHLAFKTNFYNKHHLFCIEDIGFINKYNIKKIIKLKPFYCGLVWNYKNKLGGGAFSKAGLSNYGKKIISILENNNIQIDTAHMNRKTFYDFCKITKRPILNSHANLAFFKSHKRNLTHNQIMKIIESNGFIGFSFVSKFISNNNISSIHIAKELVFFVKRYGDKNIGIGSDFNGTRNLPIDLKNYNDFKNLQKALRNEKLSKKTIKRILYKNFIDFKKRIEKI